MSAVKNPYPGIRPFGIEDAEFFFGRTQQIEELRRKLMRVNFVAVVGDSGSGKSSLIKAGLIPYLLNLSVWRIALFRPENSPMENLIQALNSDDALGPFIGTDYTHINLEYSSKGIIETYKSSSYKGNLLIVIDQFEEIFRFNKLNRDEAVRFMNLIISAAADKGTDVCVILTFRSSYVGSCSEFKGLPELINEGHFLVPRMSRQQYKEVILGPLHAQKIEMSPNLLSRLLNDIGDDPDQLPILQHALMMTFAAWNIKNENDPIDLKHYEEIGGVSSALNKHCEAILERLKDWGLADLAKLIFQRLTGIDKGEEVRNPCTLKELKLIAIGRDEDIITVLNDFRREGNNFLLPDRRTAILLDDTIIDLTHEWIMRKWSTLNSWIQEESRNEKTIVRLEGQYAYLQQEDQTLNQTSLNGYLTWSKFKEFDKGKSRRESVINWSQRYTKDFEKYTDLVYRSQSRIRRQKVNWGSLALIVFFGVIVYAAEFIYKVNETNSTLPPPLLVSERLRKDSIIFQVFRNNPQFASELKAEFNKVSESLDPETKIHLERYITKIDSINRKVLSTVNDDHRIFILVRGDDETLRNKIAETLKQNGFPNPQNIQKLDQKLAFRAEDSFTVFSSSPQLKLQLDWILLKNLRNPQIAFSSTDGVYVNSHGKVVFNRPNTTYIIVNKKTKASYNF